MLMNSSFFNLDVKYFKRCAKEWFGRGKCHNLIFINLRKKEIKEAWNIFKVVGKLDHSVVFGEEKEKWLEKEKTSRPCQCQSSGKLLAFTFTERSKQLDWLLKEWSRSSKVAIVVKCFPSSHQMLPLNTQILLHLSTQIILHLRTQILFHLSRQILFYLSTQIILHLLLSKK